MARLKIGDVIQIPLSAGRFAYGHYVYDHHEYGCLVQIFDKISNQEINVDKLVGIPNLFPPIFVGLHVPIRKGRWKIIGNLDIHTFTFPKFRYGDPDRNGKVHKWFLWDGERYSNAVILSDELKKLEVLAVWGDELLEERLETGETFYNSW